MRLTAHVRFGERDGEDRPGAIQARRPCPYSTRARQSQGPSGCTANPTRAWVTQQARQISWQIQEGVLPTRFLIHDRDSTFPAAFDTVFTSEEVTIIRTPVQAPNANAFAERWIRSAREECLDKSVILGERHLHRVLAGYVDYYNHARPHQGLEQQCPVPLGPSRVRDGPIERRDILGGLLHDYYRRAA